MPNRVQTWVIHDSDPAQKGAIRINRKDAHDWNKKGFGVFHTVNEFFLERKKENLRWINAWAVDIDKGSKDKMLILIKRGLVPTMIVETKSGYHVYWCAKDATVSRWDLIVKNRLVPFYGADPKARDLCRLLRVPGYLHLKNPSEPFLVKKVWESSVQYSERDILSFYPDVEGAKAAKKEQARLRREVPQHGEFWDKVWALDCEYALTKLSSSGHVGCETYSFRRNASGTLNIYSNGKPTSCWVDKEGRIGSLDNGGPTIAQWLNWFHKDYRKVVEIIKEVFPECTTSAQMALIS